MTAQVPGQGPMLYHGTRAGFKRGGYLFPPEFHRRAQRPGHQPGEDAYIYLTTDRDLARRFALLGRGRGRPKVLTVEPSGPVEVDPLMYEYDGPGFRSKHSARVVDVEFVEEES